MAHQIAERGKEIFHPLDNAIHVKKNRSQTLETQVYANFIYIYNTKDTSYETTSHDESNGICLPL